MSARRSRGTRPDYWHDAAIERMRARARLGAAVLLVAVIGGMLFADSLSTLMRPLVVAVENLHQAQR